MRGGRCGGRRAAFDCRISPTAVNVLATAKPIEWFERKLISSVPWRHAGAGRPTWATTVCSAASAGKRTSTRWCATWCTPRNGLMALRRLVLRRRRAVWRRVGAVSTVAGHPHDNLYRIAIAIAIATQRAGRLGLPGRTVGGRACPGPDTSPNAGTRGGCVRPGSSAQTGTQAAVPSRDPRQRQHAG